MLTIDQFDTAMAHALKEAVGSEHQLNYEARLDEAGFDSLRVSTFVLAFEEAADFVIPSECIDLLWDAKTLGEVHRLLRAHCAVERPLG